MSDYGDYRDEDQAAHVADSHDLRITHVETVDTPSVLQPASLNWWYVSLSVTSDGQLEVTYGDGVTPTEAAREFFEHALRTQVDDYIRRRLQEESEARGE